jgi:RNA polymerase sigma-70 factor, ECF subfamily
MVLDDRQDHQLVQRAARDPAALQALYDAYFRRVYAYVAGRVDDALNVEDLVSEIFIQVIKNLQRFGNHHEYSFAAWIFTIARNTVNDFYRRRKHFALDVALDSGDSGLTDESDYESLELRLIRREHATELRALIDALPLRRRDVLMLRYYAELRNNEIAQVMGIDERTVSSHLSRGLRDLYDAYTAKFTEAEEIHDER